MLPNGFRYLAPLMLAGWCHLAPAAALEYPVRPVRLVVVYPPGGGIDILARIMSQQLAEQGSEAVAGTPEQFTAFLDVEVKKWAAAVKSAGAKID